MGCSGEQMLNYEAQPSDFTQLFEAISDRYYEVESEDYARNSDAQLQWALRQNLNLQGNESVLDVGCGDGKITADFATTLP